MAIPTRQWPLWVECTLFLPNSSPKRITIFVPLLSVSNPALISFWSQVSVHCARWIQHTRNNYETSVKESKSIQDQAQDQCHFRSTCPPRRIHVQSHLHTSSLSQPGLSTRATYWMGRALVEPPSPASQSTAVSRINGVQGIHPGQDLNIIIFKLDHEHVLLSNRCQ
jgi:hypothetical protein